MVTHKELFDKLNGEETIVAVAEEELSDSDSDSNPEESVEGGGEWLTYVFSLPEQLKFMPMLEFPTDPELINKLELSEYPGDVKEYINKFLSTSYTDLFIGTLSECMGKTGIVGLIIPSTDTKNFKFYKCKYIPVSSVSSRHVIVYLLIDSQELVEYDITYLKNAAMFDITTYG